MMLSTVYQRKNTDNTVIDINSGTQPKITSNCSFAHYMRAGLAVTSAVGMITLWRTTGFLSSFWRNSNVVSAGNSLDTYPLITSRGGITFADNSFPIQPRHAKRAFGSEFQINTYTIGWQRDPSIVVLTTGDFVVVWHSSGQDGDGDGIYGQRFSSIGIPQGSEFQINTYTTGGQDMPCIAALTTGDFVVAWVSNGQDGNGYGIYGQRFSNTGVPQDSEFQINTYTVDDQLSTSVAALTTAGFVVVWQSNGQDGDRHGIYGQRFSNTGIPQGSEFRINTYTTYRQSTPSVAALSMAGFVVVWASPDGHGYGIYGQRYSSTGAQQGSEFQVNTYTMWDQWYPSVAVLSTGDFVVVWQSSGQDGDSDGIYGQRFSETGIPQGSEFQVNTYTTDIQRSPTIASLKMGGFVVIWVSNNQDGLPDTNGYNYGIYGQHYSSSGIPQWSEFQVNTYTTKSQRFSSVAALNNMRDFVVVWGSDQQDGFAWGVYGRIYVTPSINHGLTVLTVSELFNIDIGATNTTALSFDTIEITQVDPSLTLNWNDTKVPVSTVTIPDITSGRKVEITSDGTSTNPTITTKTCKDGICSEEKTTTLVTAFSLDNGNDEQIPLGVKIGLFAGAGALVASIGVFGGACLCRHNKKEQSKREKTKAFRGRMNKFGQSDTAECSETSNAPALTH